jgi:hypothetical protein
MRNEIVNVENKSDYIDLSSETSRLASKGKAFFRVTGQLQQTHILGRIFHTDCYYSQH